MHHGEAEPRMLEIPWREPESVHKRELLRRTADTRRVEISSNDRFV